MLWELCQGVKRQFYIPGDSPASESACRTGAKWPMVLRPYEGSALVVQYFRRICFHF